jgi:hypothetical protein
MCYVARMSVFEDIASVDELHRNERRFRIGARVAFWLSFPALWLSALGFDAILGDGYEWFAYLVGIIAFFSFQVVSGTCRNMLNEMHQEILKARARQSDAPTFILLRSFNADGIAHTPTRYLGKLQQKRGTPLLNDIAAGLGEYGILIAIGDPASEFDSWDAVEAIFFRTTSHRWVELFELAAQRATAILCVPGATPGVASEIEALRRASLLQKVVFIMPPTPSAEWQRNQGYIDSVKYPAQWAALQAYWQHHGITLPEYSADDLLFMYRSEGIIESPIGRSDLKSCFAASFGNLLSRMGLEQPEAAASVLRDLTALEREIAQSPA